MTPDRNSTLNPILYTLNSINYPVTLRAPSLRRGDFFCGLSLTPHSPQGIFHCVQDDIRNVTFNSQFLKKVLSLVQNDIRDVSFNFNLPLSTLFRRFPTGTAAIILLGAIAIRPALAVNVRAIAAVAAIPVPAAAAATAGFPVGGRFEVRLENPVHERLVL